jgi:hypothetical protein
VTASQAYPGDHPKIFVAGVEVELVVEVEAEPVAGLRLLLRLRRSLCHFLLVLFLLQPVVKEQ